MQGTRGGIISPKWTKRRVKGLDQSHRCGPASASSTGRIVPVPKAYTVSDGKLVLMLATAEEGGFVVTSPVEPELITEAETIEDAFRIAHDAIRALRTSRAKLLRQLASSRRRLA
jgi:antitoxin HicB